MEIKYIDIHSHFNLPQFSADLSEAIKKMEEAETATICVGTDLETSRKAIEIAEMSKNIWATVGQHPTDNDEEIDMNAFLEIAKHPKVVAIGECGLDFFRTPKDSFAIDGKTAGEKANDGKIIIEKSIIPKTVLEKQKELFEKQIKIAEEVDKPIMIHGRPSAGTMDAYEEILKILSNFPKVRANFHFFVGDTIIAKKILELGHSMSFDGPITFSHDYDEVIKMLPIENIMAETDSPFAIPEPYRSEIMAENSKKTFKRAEPWMVKEIVKTIAKIKDLDEEKTRQILLENAKQFFKILL